MNAGISVTVTDKHQRRRTLRFDQAEVTIGRAANNDIVLASAGLSKRHARVVRRDRKLIVVDLKSSNGTYVRGKRINSPQVLQADEPVYVGDHILTFQLSEAGRPAAGREGAPRSPFADRHLPDLGPDDRRAHFWARAIALSEGDVLG